MTTCKTCQSTYTWSVYKLLISHIKNTTSCRPSEVNQNFPPLWYCFKLKHWQQCSLEAFVVVTTESHIMGYFQTELQCMIFYIEISTYWNISGLGEAQSHYKLYTFVTTVAVPYLEPVHNHFPGATGTPVLDFVHTWLSIPFHWMIT